MKKYTLDRPIPGQSLTTTPKNAPYENPPEITDPEEAIQVHLERLTDKKKMSSAISLLESGVDLQTLVEGILRSAVVNGIHSIDVSLLIGPVIHEYIKITADELGVEYLDGTEEEAKKEQKMMYQASSNRALKKLKSMDMMPEVEDEEVSVEEEPIVEKKTKGLMSKESM